METAAPAVPVTPEPSLQTVTQKLDKLIENVNKGQKGHVRFAQMLNPIPMLKGIFALPLSDDPKTSRFWQRVERFFTMVIVLIVFSGMYKMILLTKNEWLLWALLFHLYITFLMIKYVVGVYTGNDITGGNADINMGYVWGGGFLMLILGLWIMNRTWCSVNPTECEEKDEKKDESVKDVTPVEKKEV